MMRGTQTQKECILGKMKSLQGKHAPNEGCAGPGEKDTVLVFPAQCVAHGEKRGHVS